MAHKVGRSFKKEILDDALGIDEDKTFGISNKTFVGKNLSKVTPGGKNNIWSQTGDFVEDKITQPVKDGVGALGALVTGGGQDNTQATLDAYNAQVSALEAKENEANRMALANTLLSRGKGKFFDVTRPEEVEKFLVEQEGKYLDPFPDYLRQSGDRLLGDLENTAENINNYIGTSDERMANFQPTLDILGGINQNAIDQLSSIYDGRLESKMNDFRDQGVDITRQLQDLNTRSGNMEYGLQRGVLDSAESYADSLGRSVDMQTALANRQFDELDRMPGLMKDQNRELEQRFGDTYLSELASARGNIGAEYGAADMMAGSEYGAADRMRGSEYGAAEGMFGAENRAADMIQRAERAKALAAGANAENLANSQQRGMRGAMVGQGRGTAQNMGNAMIRSQLGQDRGDLLADVLIRDAKRRGDAGVDYASSIGESDIGYADRTGTSDIDFANRIGGSNIDFADRVGTAGIDNSMKMENILDTEADLAGAKIGSERFEALGGINPALADVYRNEAMLNRANTELGYGDTRMTAEAQNLGLDQGIVDNDQGIYSSLMAQQLANTGMIPGLGMQEAMLPALMGEAALSGQGPLARSVSPYTSTGTLPQGQTIFQNTPYTPPAQGQRRDFLDILSDVPGYIDKGQQAWGKIKGIMG